ncbi:hypothetical protein V7S43_014621 [Phytophthora oleae]|uniref:BZIP domain-containing protein n=1 Tax=Phytophthora oleae TaxID=2107226 RepID=A0ABD3F181_9STRA
MWQTISWLIIRLTMHPSPKRARLSDDHELESLLKRRRRERLRQRDLLQAEMDQLLEEIGFLDDICDLLQRYTAATSPPDSPSPLSSPVPDSPPPGQTFGDEMDAFGREDSSESAVQGGHSDLSRTGYGVDEYESTDDDSPAPPRRRRVRFYGRRF